MECHYCGKASNPLAVCNDCADILNSAQKPYVDGMRDAEEKHAKELAKELKDLERDRQKAFAYAIQRVMAQRERK